jgi:hypothetical protein
MMMTEVAGMGSEIAPSPAGAKGKQAFNLMRQHSEDAVMTTFINNNNNNNNNTLEVDRSSPFSNHSGSNRSQDKTGVSQLSMQMQVEKEEEKEHRRHEDVEMVKRNPNFHQGGGNSGDNDTEIAAKRVNNSPTTERQKSGDEEAEYEMREEEESEDLSISHNRKEELNYQQQLQQRQSNSNSISEEDRARSRGGAEGGEAEDEGMMVMDEEGYSDDGEMPGDEDSDKDEHRITVREALMSRAYQAAAAAAKYGHGGNRYSHSQVRITTFFLNIFALFAIFLLEYYFPKVLTSFHTLVSCHPIRERERKKEKSQAAPVTFSA